MLFADSSCAQERIKLRYGNWEVRCETVSGTQREQCALVQSVLATGHANINLVVIVLKSPDNKTRILRVVAPLGILEPMRLQLKVDSTYLGRTPFTRCIPTGCVAEVIMDDKLLNQLLNGTTALFIIHQTPDQEIQIPVALGAFRDGYNNL